MEKGSLEVECLLFCRGSNEGTSELLQSHMEEWSLYCWSLSFSMENPKDYID